MIYLLALKGWKKLKKYLFILKDWLYWKSEPEDRSRLLKNIFKWQTSDNKSICVLGVLLTPPVESSTAITKPRNKSCLSLISCFTESSWHSLASTTTTTPPPTLSENLPQAAFLCHCWETGITSKIMLSKSSKFFFFLFCWRWLLVWTIDLLWFNQTQEETASF